MTDLERLRALVEMSAGLAERLHRPQESAAYRRVLDMIDGLTGESGTVCPICARGKVVDGRCDVCGMRFEEG